ncbi:MAG: protein kinase [Steroidobacteraceae bacterium]
MPNPARGDRLCGRFTLMAQIGAGGHSEVWRARDIVRREDVALKILRRDSAAAANAWAVLEHEYAATRELGHPGILKLYEPQNCDGTLVLPMALAPGGDLGALRGESYTRIVPALIEIAQALEHAHGRGVVHRDLKPGNVLLDEDGHTLIADFGVASFAGASPFADHGSPFSASPQALRGEEPAPSDDIYGLGTLAYELLAGYPPFYPHFETRRVLEEPAAELKPTRAAPPRLTALVMRMLAKTRDGRPATMRAVIDELHACLHDTVTIESEALSEEAPPPPEPLVAVSTAPIVALAREPGPGEGGTIAIELPEVVRDQWGAAGPADEVVVAPATVPEPPMRAARRRHTGVAIGLLVAAVALGLVFFLLPRLAPQATTPQAAAGAATPDAAGEDAPPPPDPAKTLAELQGGVAKRLAAIEARAAGVWGGADFAAVKRAAGAAAAQAADDHLDAAIAGYRAAGKSLADIESRAPAALASELKRGAAALEAGEPARARGAYELAARIDPSNDEAAAGLARARALESAMPLVAQAANAASAGRAAEASEWYEKALALDPANAAARAGLAQARSAVGASEYARVLANGFSALRSGDLAAARRNFESAHTMQPGASAPGEGLEQVAAAEQARAGDAARARGATLEAGERWAEALALYDDVLARDASLQFAQAGRERTAPRAELARRLQGIIDRPERLGAAAVRDEATQLLAAARTTMPSGPVLRSQIARIELLLPAYDQPVRVALESDNETSVTVQRVGALGTFLRREIELKPGRYTVTGTRAGYRDVRREVTIAPGADVQTIAVSCVEPI